GIRGVLDRGGDFELARERSPGSIALYAPSACGKSSYADAVEYLFSEDGSVAHLGKSELPHVLAGERGIKPQVSVTLVDPESGESIQITRPVRTGRVDNMPPELLPIVRAAPAHRVLRQHDLRHFVVDMTPGAKYAELSRWFGLTRLEKILEHLEITSNVLESRDFVREVEERVQDIARHTDNAVTEHDERAVLDWCEAEAERHLGTSLTIDSLDGMKKAIRTLKQLQGRIILASDVTELYQARLTLEQIATDLVSPDGQPFDKLRTRLQLCHTALTAAVAAERHAASLFTVSKHGVFQEVWDAASEVLESRLTDECPICRTPWIRSHVGSQEGALISLTSRRNELTELAAARSEQQKATRELETAIRALEARLAKISAEAEKLSLSEIETQATKLAQAARTLSTTDRFPSQLQGECEELLSHCHQFVATRLRPALQSLHIPKVPATDQVQTTITHFQALRDALVRLKELRREREEYRNIKRDFNVVADVIRERAAATVNDIVAALRGDVQSIYHKIHPTDPSTGLRTSAVPNIHIVPDTESKTLTVRVDFRSRGLPPSDRTVPPAGYLSESQINTLGLALFISSVGLFNRQFPFLFLDDVVSSYDAEHKERIADLIAERLGGVQVFLTTHDWLFYSMLKDRLHDRGWLFERISGWDFEHGPQREVDAF
ncbi:MAG: hypothetical protein ACE5I2_07495, partial [Anaerolineae bacterium]